MLDLPTELLSSTVDGSHSIGLSLSATGGVAVGERVCIGDVGLDADNFKVLVNIKQQSPDIAHGVHDQFTKPPEEIGAGDHGHLFGDPLLRLLISHLPMCEDSLQSWSRIHLGQESAQYKHHHVASRIIEISDPSKWI
ncbi:hypothetical protein ACFE04_021630 [Oxalis oulophora]